MKALVKDRLRNCVLVILASLSSGIRGAQERSATTWVRLPQALDTSGHLRHDVLLVKYKPTGKSALLGVYGKSELNSTLLKNLGADPSGSLKASDFEFYRVYSTRRRPSVGGQWDAGIESFTPNPSVKDSWLVRESMSVLRSHEEREGNVFDLDATKVILGQIAVPDKPVSGQDPAKAKADRRKATLALLEKSWRQVLDKKYDLSLVGLGNVVERMSADLNPEELNKAAFGRALSRFHQLGCREAGPDFEKLQTPGPYLEDARYYGGLCALDQGDAVNAKQRFGALMLQSSARYQDAARFYLGVVAESQDDFGAAESAYLDTVDFASDPGIVKLAKDKLAVIEDRKAQDRYAKKLVSVMAVAGFGWDSNALSLPTNVQPADLNLNSGASATYLGLGYVDVKNPWLHKLGNRFHYTYLMLGYLNSQIAPTSNLQSHSLGTSVEWGEELGFHHGLDVKYGLTYLGKLGSTSKYLTSYGARWDVSRSTTDPKSQQVDHMWTHSLEVNRQIPTAASTSGVTDGTAWLLTGSHRLRKQRGTFIYGPGADWEYKAATGSDVRYFMVGANGNFERPVGPETWKLKFSQDAAAKCTVYFSSASSRKDFLVTATGSLARTLSDKFEARSQVVLSKNFSVADYSYNRYQFNLMLSAFF